MQSFLKKIHSFRDDAAGATAIEYGLLAALIGIAIIGALSNLGATVSMAFGNFAAMLNDSYGVTVWDTTGMENIDGTEYTYNNESWVNANGTQSYNDTLTDANGNVSDWQGTISYNGAIGGIDWTANSSSYYDGQQETSYTQTNTGVGSNMQYSGTVSQTDTATGQTMNYSYTANNNGNGTWTQSDTGTDWSGNAWSQTDTYDTQSASTTSTTNQY